jgi:hypothetical protein
MSEIFADTFYFLALLSPSDKASQRAWSITAEQRSTLVTTAWVLTELANAFVVMRDRGIAGALTGDRHFEQAGFRALLK